MSYRPQDQRASTWRKGPPNATCERCATPFHARPYRIALGYDRFCSTACFAADTRSRGDQTKYAGGERREHVRVVESALGCAMPAGWETHHVNEKKRDNRPENLVACTSVRAHAVLHARPELILSAVWLGSHGLSVRKFDLSSVEPTGMRLCVKCGEVKPRSAFGRGSKYIDGLRSECRACKAASNKRAYDRARRIA
jgi:hypothetical protein